MLVYHDFKRKERLGCLSASLARAAAAISRFDLDGLRSLLIQSGQLEQAICDLRAAGLGTENYSRTQPSDQDRLEAVAKQVTDDLAGAFYSAWASSRQGGFNALAARIRSALEMLHSAGEIELSVNTPEGFAFYSLFPEQYCTSACRWACEHENANPRKVLVLGIRSIGTTLSAVVAATLRALGWTVKRMTVRPSGPPFNRRVELPAPDLAGFRLALIVDEGPGLSGSSMVAAGKWLAAAGASQIYFFPGHSNEPGAAASQEVRRWWSRTPRYFTPLEEMRWRGLSLQQMLSVEPTANSASPGVHDLSAGAWRKWAFDRPTDWPAVSKSFERQKFLSINGSSRVLWKFNGLIDGEAEVELEQMRTPAHRRFVPPLLGARLGFVAMPWICGERLTQNDAQDPQILRHIGHYIGVSAKSGLADGDASTAVDRAANMLYWNVREALGEKLADGTVRLKEHAASSDVPLSYGDGRLAPHEWVRTPSGQIFKTDCTGHSLDHTGVGRQSVLWDAAGAIVEWDLNEAQIDVLQNALQQHGAKSDAGALNFYRAAYAAFRLGMTSLGASQAGKGSAERGRLLRAAGRYKRRITQLLGQSS